MKFEPDPFLAKYILQSDVKLKGSITKMDLSLRFKKKHDDLSLIQRLLYSNEIEVLKKKDDRMWGRAGDIGSFHLKVAYRKYDDSTVARLQLRSEEEGVSRFMKMLNQYASAYEGENFYAPTGESMPIQEVLPNFNYLSFLRLRSVDTEKWGVAKVLLCDDKIKKQTKFDKPKFFALFGEKGLPSDKVKMTRSMVYYKLNSEKNRYKFKISKEPGWFTNLEMKCYTIDDHSPLIKLLEVMRDYCPDGPK